MQRFASLPFFFCFPFRMLVLHSLVCGRGDPSLMSSVTYAYTNGRVRGGVIDNVVKGAPASLAFPRIGKIRPGMRVASINSVRVSLQASAAEVSQSHSFWYHRTRRSSSIEVERAGVGRSFAMLV